MTKQAIMAGVAVWLCSGCEAMNRDDGKDSEDHESRQGEELSSLENYLVGVWSGSWGDGEVKYLVLQEDRTACEWVRQGDDFGTRYDEVQFESWSLDETLDEDGTMLLRLGGVDGEVFAQDAYEPEEDLLLPGGYYSLAMSWDDVLIDCDGFGTNSHTVDVERGGEPYEGSTDDPPDGEEPSGGPTEPGA